MKQILFAFIAGAILLLSSCGGPSKDIYKITPESTLAVVSIHPGNLFEKGKLQEMEFLREEMNETELSRSLIEDPEYSGIDMDEYSAFFVFGKDPNYGCISLPVASKDELEARLDEIEKEMDESFEKSEIANYTALSQSNSILLYNNKIAFVLFSMGGPADDITTVAEELVNLDKEEGILSDKDFNYFLKKQKDLNAWFTSSNISSISGAFDLDDAMDMFGGIKNNYGHMFLDFRPGAIEFTTNLRFNQSIKETIAKYNFLDNAAIKDLLKYLPSEDVLFVGNTNVNPDKMFSLLKFINNDIDDMLEKIAEELEMEVEDIEKTFGGEAAFSIGGFENMNLKIDSAFEFGEKLPVVVGATRLKDKKIFDEFIEVLSKEMDIEKTEAYYSMENKGLPVYMLLHNKDLIVSNKKEIVEEIHKSGSLEENVTKTDFAPILSENPVCFFLNLDSDSYSSEIEDFIQKELDEDISEGYERFGEKLKSLSFSANLEEWNIRLVLKDSGENSLYTLLSQIDK